MTLTRAILAAAGSVMLWLDRRLNVWEDEGYTLETTSHSVLEAARGAMRYEQYPPLYFALLAAWRGIDRSPAFARTFSTLAVLLTARDTARLVRRVAPDAPQPMVTLALATHPFLVWAGTEARAYALVTWQSARIIAAFSDAHLDEHRPARARLALIAWTLGGIYTQYYQGFVFAGCGAALAIARPKRLPAFALDAAAIAVGLLPLVRELRQQLPNYGENFASPPTVGWLVRNLGGSLAGFLIPSQDMGRLWRPLVGAGSAALAAALLRDAASREGGRVPVTIFLTSSLLLATTLYVARIKPVLPKHAAPLFVPAVLAAFAVLRTRKRTVAATALVVSIGVRALVNLCRQPLKYGDYGRAAEHVMRYENRGEPVLIFQPEASLAFRHHYRGRNTVAAIPIEIPFDRYDLSRYRLHGARQIEETLARAGVRDRFWLLTTATANPLGNDLHPELLERFIAERCEVLTDEHFVGSRVRLLSQRRDNVSGADGTVYKVDQGTDP